MTLPAPPSILACNRCDSPIQISDLDQGLAVRVDGELICQMCVDSLPGEAQVQINQLRAMRGLNATTYTLADPRHPALHLFTFTTAGNITVHRRAVRTDGRFAAPPLPKRSEPGVPAPAAVPPNPPPPPPPGVRRSSLPMVASVIALILAAGAAGLLLQHRPGEVHSAPGAARATDAPPAPSAVVKTRLDFDADPATAWAQANQDRECPEPVRLRITEELLHKRSQQLDEAEQAINDGHLADATRLISALSLPDDIAFRELRQRAGELRALASERTALAATRTAPLPGDAKPAAPPPPSPVTPARTAPVLPLPTPAPTSSPAIAASTGESWRLPGKDLALDDSAQWKRVHNELHLTADLASVRRALVLEGGTYQVWIQAINHARDASVTVSLGGVKAKPIEYHTGVKLAWVQVQTDTHPLFTVPAGDAMLEIDASGRGLEIHQLLVYDGAMPSPEQSDRLHAKPPRWGAPPAVEPKETKDAKDAKEPTGVVAWKPHFIQVAKEAQVRQLPTDGTVYLPPGWPGGCQGFWRSVRLASKKHHSMTIDLRDTSTDKGGVALLLHPGRLDRKQLQVTVFDVGGRAVPLPPFQFSGSDDWDIFTIQANGDLEGAQIASIQLEDEATADFAPEDGFVLAKVSTCVNQAATPALLALRPPALVRDEHRQKNLLKLLDAISRYRKHAITKAIDPAKVMLLAGSTVTPEWRAAARNQLDLVLPGRLPATLIQEMTFQDAWFDALFKSQGAGQPALLDPQGHHLVIVVTAGAELRAGVTVTQAMEGFWKRRIEYLISNGMLPVVVLGPDLVESDRRADADKLWAEAEDFIAKQLPGVPMIDLRPQPTPPVSELTPAGIDFSTAMLGDGYAEFVYWLRRAATLK